MIRDITIGQYYPAKSVLHRLDPRTKFLGTLGFLAEVDKNSVYPALDRLLSDDYELEDRMMLEGKIYRGEELIGKDIALNDIVIGREGHLRVIRFKNYVNDSYMNSYNADGIICRFPRPA